MKQTAVEWFYNELIEHKIIKKEKHFTFVKNFATTYELLLEQAKQMEKRQMEDAYAYGMGETSQWDNINKMFDQYYNETHGK